MTMTTEQITPSIWVGTGAAHNITGIDTTELRQIDTLHRKGITDLEFELASLHHISKRPQAPQRAHQEA